jgi:hypothetical protein
MKSTHLRAHRKLCPTCDRLIYLNRSGHYRRHYADEPDGRRHLCAGSGNEFGSAERRPHDLGSLDL